VCAAKPDEGKSNQCSLQTASRRRAEREDFKWELHCGHRFGSSWVAKLSHPPAIVHRRDVVSDDAFVAHDPGRRRR
jgi:hypothetical protein